MGRREPEERAPEGPMSFLVDDRERIYMLDQVNQRVQVFDQGRLIQVIDLPGDSYQELRLDGQGDLVLLDRLVRQAVDVVDFRGEIRKTIAIDRGGGTTGLFVRNDGIWVEYEHRRLVRVADGRSVPGRFSADGRRLFQAGLQGRYAAEVTVRQTERPEAHPRGFARVRFDQRVHRLVDLVCDRPGRVLLVAQTESSLQVVVLDATGREVERHSLASSDQSMEQFRRLHLTADGKLYRLRTGATGVSVRRVLP